MLWELKKKIRKIKEEEKVGKRKKETQMKSKTGCAEHVMKTQENALVNSRQKVEEN